MLCRSWVKEEVPKCIIANSIVFMCDYSLVIIAFSASLEKLLHCCAPHVRPSASWRCQNTYTPKLSCTWNHNPVHNSLATSFHVQAQKQQTSKSLLKQGIIRARDSNKFFRFHPSIQCSLTRQSACESVRPAGSGQAGSPSVHFKCCQQSTVIGCAFYSSYSSHRWLHADAVFIYEC